MTSSKYELFDCRDTWSERETIEAELQDKPAKKYKDPAKAWDFRKKRKTPSKDCRVTKKELEELLEEHGTLEKVGEVIGVSRERVRQYISLMGLSDNSKKRHRSHFLKNNKANMSNVIRALVYENLTLHECSKKYGVSMSKIERMLTRYSAKFVLREIMQKQHRLISLNIRTLRRLKNWTQVELAQKIHSYQESISQIENQYRSRDSAKLDKFAEAFGVTRQVLCNPLDYDTIMTFLGNDCSNVGAPYALHSETRL